MTSQVPTGWKPEYPFEQIKLTLREGFIKAFPDLKWSTTGGTRDIADWWIHTLTEEIEGMIVKERKGRNPRRESWDAGFNAALDSVLNLLK